MITTALLAYGGDEPPTWLEYLSDGLMAPVPSVALGVVLVMFLWLRRERADDLSDAQAQRVRTLAALDNAGVRLAPEDADLLRHYREAHPEVLPGGDA